MLDLAGEHPFARPLINSGRLSLPAIHDDSPLNGPDALAGPARTRPGAPCADAPVGNGWLLSRLGGGFRLLGIGVEVPGRVVSDGVAAEGVGVAPSDDPSGALAARYLGDAERAVYLVRPDQHVAARWPHFDEGAVRAALDTALARA